LKEESYWNTSDAVAVAESTIVRMPNVQPTPITVKKLRLALKPVSIFVYMRARIHIERMSGGRVTEDGGGGEHRLCFASNDSPVTAKPGGIARLLSVQRPTVSAE